MSIIVPLARHELAGPSGSAERPERYALTQAEAEALLLLADGSSGDEQMELAFVYAMLLGLRVFKDRQKKYGRENIAESGASGVRVRAADKLARLKQLYTHGKGGESMDEPVKDSWIDSGNYGFIGLLVHLGLWPGAEDA